MTRIRRSWQGLSLLLGLAGVLLLLSGQGCPMSAPVDGNLDATEEGDTTSLTDSDGTIKSEDAGGPTAQVLFPNGGELVEVNSIVEIRIFARHPSIPDPVVRVFYDRDSSSANGNITIGTIKASAGGINWDTSGLATGAYYIGCELVGVTPAVVDYCDASFQMVPAGQGGNNPNNPNNPNDPGDPTDQDILLTVTTPRNTVTLFESRTFQIRWSTSLLPGEGTAVVFREPDFDEDGLPDGQALRDVIGNPGMDAALQRQDFDTSGVVGNFFIGVTVTSNDGKTATAYSVGTIKILSPVLWVGDLATKRDEDGRVIAQSGSFQGGVFKGFQPYDNLGSAMLAADDYDGDGRNEIVLAAQFAKPFFFQKDGRGAGEAYMVYGTASRLRGDFEANNTGSTSLPGVIFTGVLPNPFGNKDVGSGAYGNPYAYTVDGRETEGYDTEGLRSLTMIPDQDLDGRREIAFGFPWCDSYSLASMQRDGYHPTPLSGLGRLENDGHFLRGGLVMVSSANPLLTNRNFLNRHLDRYMMLQEVGQVFAERGLEMSIEDLCAWRFAVGEGVLVLGGDDTVTYPCDGFWQSTLPSLDTYGRIDPPRLADPAPASQMAIPGNDDVFGCDLRLVDLTQVDAPPISTSLLHYNARSSGDYFDAGYCDGAPAFAPFGMMYILGTGFYVNDGATSCGNQVFAQPVEPYGCRMLGQTTTQLYTSPPTTANRFAASLSTSGSFLLAGAPMRTALKRDVVALPTDSRFESGEVYMLDMRRNSRDPDHYFWRLPDIGDDDGDPNTPPITTPYSDEIPQPHNFIIDDVGYTRYNTSGCDMGLETKGPWWEMDNPIRVVGANPTDRIGEQVTGLYDLDADGVADMAVGGAGTNSGRGGVYVIYRRQAGLEADYLLERVQSGVADANGQYGLFIIGEQGENLGTSLAGLGPANLGDDYNDDGFSDLLIGSPNATPAAGFEAGQVCILKGGKRLSNPAGGITLNELRAAEDAVLLTGAEPGDRAGEVVASAGDVNGDGVADLLIAAPNATVPDIKFVNPGQDSLRSLRVTFQYDSDGNGTLDATGIGIDRNGDGAADPLNGNNDIDVNGDVVYDADDDLTNAGLVYVVFGGTHLKGTIKLDEIGSKSLPGFVLVGRATDYELGGGRTQNNLLSRGLASAGDHDGDGRGDLLISSVLADPDGKENAGEIYIVYGFAP